MCWTVFLMMANNHLTFLLVASRHQVNQIRVNHPFNMPIISTYTKGTSPSASGQGFNFVRSTRQKVPYVIGPMDKGTIRPANNFGERGNPNAYVYAAGLDYNQPWDDMQIVAYNGARRRLMSRLTPARAAMAVNLAQLNQGVEMIALRSKQLYRAYSKLRRLDLLGFARELSISPKPKHLRNDGWKKDTSGTWLEYTFGWKPLVADIYNAADVLSSEFDVVPLTGAATERRILTYDRQYERVTVFKTVRVRCKASIRVTNPNLALANQLGLLNPAAVAWDLVPFSFVVDWFVKINQFTATLNDMAGFSFVRPSTSRKIFAEVDVYYKPPYKPSGTASSGGYRFIRDDSIPAPTFNPKFQLPMPSTWLAVTSTALLVQVFSGRR